MQQLSPSAETEALLARLSQRPGVQSTLILSRETGAIVRSSGLITAEELEQENMAAAATASATGAPPTTNSVGETNGTDSGDANSTRKKGTRNAEDVARMVWEYVKCVGALVEELNGSHDEAKLLRVRTKRNEVVVVPDAKFLAVVIHDTPPA
ncbi:hypothetical protein LTR35_003637 [Friedmanniomyces endolithicus]|uniref:Roadblock/LAMTOR2 domain-containing protein n=1 Tax=Friedmanniomyces endolithicus TaxID=329885 RepID=A0AAN6G009_9PEZI|nr:hypothetical protein LTS00_014755 [Friedmanniomyces endolithicus]KAK0288163.1 hypothetical protein LTR35_003637 [Friedmanniomyces endolithicus]KAK0326294.1 hypothetical protein LTR82_003041 [Friedmanniomyces endolithicus]KAK0976213.1 hypothetical protein LTR54_016569 [Friedmanniomyces endolithicus]